MPRRTKIIIGVGVVLLLIALGVFLYFYFRTPAAVTPTPGEFPSTEDIGGTTTGALPPPIGEGGKGPRLVKLAEGPVAGAITGKSGGALVVRFIETSNGNASEVNVATLEKKRLTITTIPKVQEALWNKAGSAVIARYLKEDGETIESFAATIRPKSDGAEGELVGSFLPSNITAVSASPSGKDFAYIRKEGNRATLITAPFSGSPKTEVFRSPILEWTPLWFSENTVALLSKPSVLAEGVLLFVNRATGASETVLSGITGLTALPSPNGALVLASESGETDFAVRVIERKNGRSTEVSPATLPEKCVWGKNNTTLFCGAPQSIPAASYPDSWYQGAVSFADDFWEIDAPTGISHLLLTSPTPMDLTLPLLDGDETHLIFINKKDGSLWSLRLEE